MKRRDAWIGLRVTGPERQLLKTAASAAQVSTAELVREAALREAEAVLEATAETREEPKRGA